jgi:bisphosphoglycerate-dependent phosphoglycerate mutase
MSTETRSNQTGTAQNKDQDLVRLNVNLNADTARALREIARERDISFTEAVRRAISVYNFIETETKNGRHIQTADTNRENVRDLILL